MTYLFTYLLTYLPTYLLTYLHTYLQTYFLLTSIELSLDGSSPDPNTRTDKTNNNKCTSTKKYKNSTTIKTQEIQPYIVTQWYYNILYYNIYDIYCIYYNITILWEHRRIFGPSLTETSLRGA